MGQICILSESHTVTPIIDINAKTTGDKVHIIFDPSSPCVKIRGILVAESPIFWRSLLGRKYAPPGKQSKTK